MFAGPNGSGKSSLKTVLPAGLEGVYLNPDDLERDMRERGFVDFRDHGLPEVCQQALQFLRGSKFLKQAYSIEALTTVSAEENCLYLNGITPDSYFASALCDFLRHGLLERRKDFTFETVMSHPGKVEILAHAQSLGYRTYLYYVATEDPIINISRVTNRVRFGGHAVPTDKIEERYYRSLNLLVSAIRHTNRAYVFDNSGEGKDRTWIAEITDGCDLELRSDRIPAWFQKFVLDQFGSERT
jgi:predicted ABC-type ATPase